MKRLFLLLVLTIFSTVMIAQTTADALRYSMQTYNGTARSTAMGGAFGALGGDFSSISINPAGLGVYRTSELTFTPSLEVSKTTNSGASQEKYSFAVGNLGYVFTFRPRIENKDGWKNFNVGFGYNRVNNFQKDALMQVMNSETSLLDVFGMNANGVSAGNLSTFYEGLAFDTYLLDTIEGAPTQYLTPLIEGDIVNQRKHITEKGNMGEYVFSFATNYNNKLYLGAALNIQSLYYKSTSTYTESLADESELDDYIFEEYLRTTGTGYNFKFGAIYKATQNLRLGFAFHTPTFYSMTDDFENTITSHFNTEDSEGFMDYESVSPFGEYDYDLETPQRTILSAAYLFGKKALISVDYEFMDYANAKFSNGGGGNYDFFGTVDNPGTNDEISSIYQSTGNLRIGGEYRVNSYFSLRGGFGYFESPYKSRELNGNSEYNTYSLGWGLKRDNFFFDMAYMYNTQDQKSLFYYYEDQNTTIKSQTVNLETQHHQFRMTFGFKF